MEAIQIRLGGYGPPETSFSRAFQIIGDKLEARFGSGVEVNYVWNIMDLGYLGRDILWLVESGVLTAGYQSSSYLTDRVPELGFLDLPFLFANNETARANMDGALGAYLTARIEDQCNYRIAGYFENGFRHISNRLRPVHKPADLAGMKIRVLPSTVHEKTFALLGAEPMQMDLTEAVARVSNGTLDAQENPFANTVTYGVHNHHPYHTLSGHFYLSRPIFINRTQFDCWPEEVRQAFGKAVGDAVNFQRGLAATEADDARRAIEAVGGSIVKLSPSEQAAFADAVVPVREEAVSKFDRKMFNLLQSETG